MEPHISEKLANTCHFCTLTTLPTATLFVPVLPGLLVMSEPPPGNTERTLLKIHAILVTELEQVLEVVTT